MESEPAEDRPLIANEVVHGGRINAEFSCASPLVQTAATVTLSATTKRYLIATEHRLNIGVGKRVIFGDINRCGKLM